ncbi:MAG: hypothetical protein HS116_08905 [Planctomycetes bacterium]|nr:hypothetical protein [Planctomycetota bacterium]
MRGRRWWGWGVALLALCAATAAGWAADDLQPAAGESKVEGGEATAALAALKASFDKHPSVRVKVRAVMNDELLGERVETGEMLMQRPDKVLRIFHKPDGSPWKAWRLNGVQVAEFAPSLQPPTRVKDFSAAPKLLALLKAASTMDLAALQEYFDVHLFKAPGADSKPAQWRVVLAKKPGAKLGNADVPYQFLIARVAEGAAFFSSLEKVPPAGAGDRLVEHFGDLKVEAELSSESFEHALLKDAGAQKPEAVKDPE